MKKCSRCGLSEPDVKFTKDNRTKTGIKYWCNVCSYDSYKRYSFNNRTKRLCQAARVSAKKRNLEFCITEKDIIIPEYCPVLGIKLELGNLGVKDFNGPSLDRIDNKLGYIPGNIMVISRKANVMKNNATKGELLAFCKFFIKEIEENESVGSGLGDQS